jgi:transaldolase
MLLERMKGDSSKAAHDLFRVFDLDGDGFITREEWAGTDAVFDALDLNGDGRITPEEMGAGLGAAFLLQTH